MALGDKKIVLLSGGPDCTALLYDLLKNSTDELHVHYIWIKLLNGLKSIPEKESVFNILNWCRKAFPDRPFTYTESSMRSDSVGCVDHYVWALHGAMLVRAGFGNTLYTGRIATDNTEVGSLNQARANGIFQIVAGPNAKWEFPIDHLCKRDVIKSIPKELFKLTWSCQNPILSNNEYKECYTCIGCIRRIEAMWQSELFDRDEKLYRAVSESFDMKCPTLKEMTREELGKITVPPNKLPPLPSEDVGNAFMFSLLDERYDSVSGHHEQIHKVRVF